MDDMNQTSKPPKTIINHDTYHENAIPEETDSQEFHLPEELDLPKPSLPMDLGSYEIHDQLSQLEPPPQCYPQFQKSLKNSISRRHFSPSTGKTPRGEKEAVAELLMILVDCMDELNTRSRESLLRKFFSEIERDERLEMFIVERLRHSKVKAVSDLCEKLPSSVLGQINNSDGANSVSTDQEDAGSSEFVEIYGTRTSERSLVETVEDLSQELERFKIRTLDLGGMDKDETKT